MEKQPSPKGLTVDNAVFGSILRPYRDRLSSEIQITVAITCICSVRNKNRVPINRCIDPRLDCWLIPGNVDDV